MRASNGISGKKPCSIRFKLLFVTIAAIGIVLAYRATAEGIGLYRILYDHHKAMEVHANTPTI